MIPNHRAGDTEYIESVKVPGGQARLTLADSDHPRQVEQYRTKEQAPAAPRGIPGVDPRQGNRLDLRRWRKIDALPLALSGVIAGEAALPRHLVSLVIDEFRERGRRRPLLKRRGVVLTDREWEVLELMSHGLTTFEIADRLFIEPVTVRTHVSAILKKLRVTSRKAALQLIER
jgi:DNA-binding CsgD family transcriptional regulator